MVLSAILAVTLLGTPLVATATRLGPTADQTQAQSKSSSYWLERGANLEGRGKYAEAGEAYRQALAVLSEEKRSTVGADIATLSAAAYLMAFDGDIDHLKAGVEVLQQWIERTEPEDEAPKLQEVKLLAAQFHTIVSRLEQANAAMVNDDLAQAYGRYEVALKALQAPSVRGSSGPAMDWVEQHLVDVQSRIDEATPPPQDARVKIETETETETVLATNDKRLSTYLLTAGIIGSAAGASVLGSGITSAVEFQRTVRAEESTAQTFESMPNIQFDRPAFNEAVLEYEQRARRKNIAMILGGSVLMAGGVAASVIGLVKLRQARRAPGPTAKAWLTPTMSRSNVGLSLTARFR